MRSLTWSSRCRCLEVDRQVEAVEGASRESCGVSCVCGCVEARRCGLISAWRRQVGGGGRDKGGREPPGQRHLLACLNGPGRCLLRAAWVPFGGAPPPALPPSAPPCSSSSLRRLSPPPRPCTSAPCCCPGRPAPPRLAADSRRPGQMTPSPGHLSLSWVTCAIPDPAPAGPSTLLWCARPRRPIQTLEGFLVTSRPPPPCGVARGRCPGEEARRPPPPRPLTLHPPCKPARNRSWTLKRPALRLRLLGATGASRLTAAGTTRLGALRRCPSCRRPPRRCCPAPPRPAVTLDKGVRRQRSKTCHPPECTPASHRGRGPVPAETHARHRLCGASRRSLHCTHLALT